VIVESHSDHVLNGIRVAVREGRLSAGKTRLHFFSREAGGSAFHVTPEVDKSGRLSFWPDGFFDQWERSLDALLG
jgi:predicted ATPase